MSIKESLDKFKALGRKTLKFSAMDGAITGVFRVYTRNRDAEIMEWAGEMDGLLYTRRYKIGMLSNAIIELNGISFRELKNIEIDADTKVPVNIYLRDNIIGHDDEGWDESLINALIKQYQVLQAKVELEAIAGVEYENLGIPEQISVLESKLEALRAIQERVPGQGATSEPTAPTETASESGETQSSSNPDSAGVPDSTK